MVFRSQLITLAIHVSFSTAVGSFTLAVVSLTPKLPTILSLLSSGYIFQASMICLMLFWLWLRAAEEYRLEGISAHNKAIWQADTTIRFRAEGGFSGRAAFEHETDVIQVDAVRLKNYLDRPVDLLKIDIEGAEYEVLRDCRAEPSLSAARSGDRFQFERMGYFCADPDSSPGMLVVNRTVTLKDSWAKIQKAHQDGRK